MRKWMKGCVVWVAVLVAGPQGRQSISAQVEGRLQAALPREFVAGGLGHPSAFAPSEISQFGRLVGVWNARQEMRAADGTWVDVGSALWIWKYALGGVGVQDLWFQPREELPDYLGALDHDYALTALRMWDQRSGRWNVAWAANGLGRAPGDDFGTAHATWTVDRLVMTSPGTGGGDQRITFSEITDDSFRWTSEFSTDGGVTWTEVMRVHARRVQ